jgi:hypothetical protein
MNMEKPDDLRNILLLFILGAIVYFSTVFTLFAIGLIDILRSLV